MKATRSGNGTAKKRAVRSKAESAAAARGDVLSRSRMRVKVRSIEREPGQPMQQFVARTQSVESVVGSSAELARLLGVDRSRVSRWKSGRETPGPQAARELIDLDYVVARARLVLHEDAIALWLRSPNLHLNGGTPVSRIVVGHADEAIEALEAFEEGAYA